MLWSGLEDLGEQYKLKDALVKFWEMLHIPKFG